MHIVTQLSPYVFGKVSWDILNFLEYKLASDDASSFSTHTNSYAQAQYIKLLMVHWVVGSIFHGGPIELFLIPASAPSLV